MNGHSFARPQALGEEPFRELCRILVKRGVGHRSARANQSRFLRRFHCACVQYVSEIHGNAAAIRIVPDHRVTLPRRTQSLTVTVFTSVYCCNPYSPISLPIPDCLKPPNGAAASNTS